MQVRHNCSCTGWQLLPIFDCALCLLPVIHRPSPVSTVAVRNSWPCLQSTQLSRELKSFSQHIERYSERSRASALASTKETRPRCSSAVTMAAVPACGRWCARLTLRDLLLFAGGNLLQSKLPKHWYFATLRRSARLAWNCTVGPTARSWSTKHDS